MREASPELLLGDIINCLTADERVLGELLRFATGFSFAKSNIGTDAANAPTSCAVNSCN
jgi:hypothetical protein